MSGRGNCQISTEEKGKRKSEEKATQLFNDKVDADCFRHYDEPLRSHVGDMSIRQA